MSHLSASHLSQIEQDKKLPSLAALASIAEVLEINPRYLLESEENQVFITRANLKPEDDVPLLSIMSTELTSAASGSDIAVHRLALQPHASGLEFEPHPGEVFGFVLEGQLTITIEDQQIELEAGNSIHYEANQYYCLECGGDKPCLVIWGSSPPWTDFDTKIQAVLEVEANIPAKAQ
jgi:mannose-6-phosphate isomerase-like protein (cupin superfamily)